MGEVITELAARISLIHHAFLRRWERLDSLAGVWRHFDQIIQMSSRYRRRDIWPHSVLHFQVVRRRCLRRTHVLQVVQVTWSWPIRHLLGRRESHSSAGIHLLSSVVLVLVWVHHMSWACFLLLCGDFAGGYYRPLYPILAKCEVMRVFVAVWIINSCVASIAFLEEVWYRNRIVLERTAGFLLYL